jgi:hypothetical protein
MHHLHLLHEWAGQGPCMQITPFGFQVTDAPLSLGTHASALCIGGVIILSILARVTLFGYAWMADLESSQNG